MIVKRVNAEVLCKKCQTVAIHLIVPVQEGGELDWASLINALRKANWVEQRDSKNRINFVCRKCVPDTRVKLEYTY